MRYNPQAHRAVILSLWQPCFGDRWHLTATKFAQLFDASPHLHFLAQTSSGTVCGFIAGSLGAAATAGVQLLMVAPAFRRQGVGSSLFCRILQEFKLQGVQRVRIGCGGEWYLWPGVPVEMVDAVSFFRCQGAELSESALDLVRELADYTTPKDVTDRLSPGYGFRCAEARDLRNVVDFERCHFPEWADYFVCAAREAPADVLLAHDDDGEIVGSALVTDRNLTWDAGGCVWESMFDGPIGAVGCLGVMPPHRERGVGLALAARATQMLQSRGAAVSYLGWTWLAEWYGRLGYRIWQEYKLGELTLH